VRTLFVLICSLAFVCAARGEKEQKKETSHTKNSQHVATHAEHPTGGSAHVQHPQAPQRPATTGGRPPAGGAVIRPTGPESHPETAPAGNAAAKPAAFAPAPPVYHYNFPTKSGLIGRDFTRPLTPEEQSATAREIANGQSAGTQAPAGVGPASKQVGAGAAAARKAEIEDAKRRGAVSTDRATKLAPPPTQAKVNPFRPQHFNLPSKPDPAIASVKFEGTGHIQGSETWTDPKYAVLRNYHHEWHDKDWWRSHHTRIVFVVGGWYYWHANYWYPAWGYQSSSVYAYDSPIYAFNNLEPDQVVANVQAALQQLGYYQGPINGVMDAPIREAIANYQHDQGLYTTSVIDEPTLAALGMA
jgi:hypothetical protein